MSALQEIFDPPMPPSEITGRSVWYGPDMAKREEEWIRPFSDAELTELEVALRGVQSRGLGIMEVNCEAFPLPTLAIIFEEIRHEILRGRGFILLRGLPVDRYSIEESAVIYFGKSG